ncbi:MAG: 30S ribosomal protein S9 [Candidatus Magasanikbacteria bacterium]|nr:30S ribosomal protein S9 [Candidatus Magasanikbacteria bacterium]
MAESKKAETFERAVGRRKTAAARVRLSAGKGLIVVNNKTYTVYFPTIILQQTVRAPLEAVGKSLDTDVSVRVAGGGTRGQAEAVRHGIARALLRLNPDFRPVLRAEGFLTRDPRAKERKKFGLYKARRAHQWRKR